MCTGEVTSPRDWWLVRYTLGDQIVGSEDKSLTAHAWYPENKMADFRRRRVVLFLMMLLDEEERKTVNRTHWHRKWLQRREVMGAYHSIFMELAVGDAEIL